MTTTRKELNFKRCYVNGKKSGVASYDNGGAALLYFGHSLGDGLGEVAAKKLGQEAGTLHQFNNYIELSAATVAGIQAVLPGAVVEFEGSKEYNAQILPFGCRWVNSTPAASKAVRNETNKQTKTMTIKIWKQPQRK